MIIRKAYLLTCDENSERAIFCKNLLDKIGFEVIIFKAIPNEDRVLSNKNSFLEIYKLISEGNDNWVYVFEDDINIHEEVSLEEIIKYENVAENKDFFYLGCCVFKQLIYPISDVIIDNDKVRIVNGNVRGAHAMAFSKNGAKEIYNIAKFSPIRYMDVIHDIYTSLHPTYVMRFNLESYIEGHMGLFYQDRKKFVSLVH